MVLEICVDSVESAEAAYRGSAQRLELCSNLSSGGITPSAGLIGCVRKRVPLELNLLLRPRPGDFVYTDSEIDVMRYDIAQAKRLGADSVVFGVLDVHGDVDRARMQELVELARPLKVTFHRAFDMTSDLFASLDVLMQLGVDRVLTSGGGVRAIDGADTLQRLQQKAQGAITIMPGGGITPENILEVATRTGATEFHSGLRTRMASPVRNQKPPVFLGEASRDVAARQEEYARFVVLDEDVRRLREQLMQLEIEQR
ncbi:copper homeostasis protein CutC [Edaphobacter aggregans]|uniref:copper homeostasis protein CutC n=1 Tax=Edaphobacter aggregans TaxID=570835 RepID=UPI0005521704|nr:copper homeostasis protein CutC [Edaphobacter aggregans]